MGMSRDTEHWGRGGQSAPTVEKRPQSSEPDPLKCPSFIKSADFDGPVISKEPQGFGRIGTRRIGTADEYRTVSSRPIVTIDGKHVGDIDQVNPGIITRDKREHDRAQKLLREIGLGKLFDIISDASLKILQSDLRVGEAKLSLREYCLLQAAVTGATFKDCTHNVLKVFNVMSKCEQLLLTHLAALRTDFDLSDLPNITNPDFHLRTKSLGAVLPSNSPGVHQLWVPYLPIVPVLLKPGSGDVFSPERIRNACIESGYPPEAFGIYHGGGEELERAVRSATNRCMFFGAGPNRDHYKEDTGVDLHGPGYSKIILGRDNRYNWQQHIPLIERSITDNAGRSCINTSIIYAPKSFAHELARFLNEVLGAVEPRQLDDPNAVLAAYNKSDGAANNLARMYQLAVKGDGTIMQRDKPHIFTGNGFSFLCPVVAYFDSPNTYAQKWEFYAPSVAVVGYDEDAHLPPIGRTLICTALTEDPAWLQHLRTQNVKLLHEDPVPTTQFDQLSPLEANVMTVLFGERCNAF